MQESPGAPELASSGYALAQPLLQSFPAHLLCTQGLEFLLQPRAETQLQLLTLLTRSLQLPKCLLQPLHLLHVGLLLAQLLLSSRRPALRVAQSLLQQLSPPPLVLDGTAQQSDLPL